MGTNDGARVPALRVDTRVRDATPDSAATYQSGTRARDKMIVTRQVLAGRMSRTEVSRPEASARKRMDQITCCRPLVAAMTMAGRKMAAETPGRAARDAAAHQRMAS